MKSTLLLPSLLIGSGLVQAAPVKTRDAFFSASSWTGPFRPNEQPAGGPAIEHNFEERDAYIVPLSQLDPSTQHEIEEGTSKLETKRQASIPNIPAIEVQGGPLGQIQRLLENSQPGATVGKRDLPLPNVNVQGDPLGEAWRLLESTPPGSTLGKREAARAPFIPAIGMKKPGVIEIPPVSTTVKNNLKSIGGKVKNLFGGGKGN